MTQHAPWLKALWSVAELAARKAIELTKTGISGMALLKYKEELHLKLTFGASTPAQLSLGCQTLCKIRTDRAERRDHSTSRLRQQHSPQTNRSCPVPSPGVPFCRSRTHGSSACYSLTCLLPLRRSYLSRGSHFCYSDTAIHGTDSTSRYSRC